MNPTLNIASWMEKWNQQDFSKAGSPARKSMLIELFKAQIKTLEALQLDCVIHEDIELNIRAFDRLDSRKVYRLAKMKKRVVRIALRFGRPGLVPFLPVLPRKMVKTYNIITRLMATGENWMPALSLNRVEDKRDQMPHRHEVPYFIFNIDEGWSGKDLSPAENIVRIKEQQLRAMNLAEAMAYQMHVRVINRQDSRAFIHACGSSYRGEYVPGIHIDQSGCPGLTWNDTETARNGWICPSYKFDRIALSWQGVISIKAWIKRTTIRKISK